MSPVPAIRFISSLKMIGKSLRLEDRAEKIGACDGGVFARFVRRLLALYIQAWKKTRSIWREKRSTLFS
jgi:hypothetical protein